MNFNILVILVIIVIIFYYLSYNLLLLLLVFFILYNYQIVNKVNDIFKSTIIQPKTNVNQLIDNKYNTSTIKSIIINLQKFKKYNKPQFNHGIELLNTILKLFSKINKLLDNNEIYNYKLSTYINKSELLINKCINSFQNINYKITLNKEIELSEYINQLYTYLYTTLHNLTYKYNNLFKKYPNSNNSPIYLDSRKAYNEFDMHHLY